MITMFISKTTWPGYEGENLNVVAYSSCDSVQLFLNNKLLGAKVTSRETAFKATWQIPYKSIKITNNYGQK